MSSGFTALNLAALWFVDNTKPLPRLVLRIKLNELRVNILNKCDITQWLPLIELAVYHARGLIQPCDTIIGVVCEK